MNFGRIIAIAKKQLLSIGHDPRSMALMFLAPIMAMLIFGFAFGSKTKHVPVLIINGDKGQLTGNFIDNIDSELLDISLVPNIDDAKNQVQNGQKVAAIIFPESFSADALSTVTPQGQVQQPKGAKAEIYIDSTDQQLTSVIPQALSDAGTKLLSTQKTISPVIFETIYAFPKAKDARYIDYFVAGVMVFAITVFTTLLTLLAFVSERANGTLDRLRITPATEAEIVIGNELAFGIIATVQGILLLSVAYFVYNILIVGSVALAGLLIILTAIDAQVIGVLISAAAKRESQAVQFLPFIIFPTFLLSGIFVPIQSLPNWLKPFSYVLPSTWSILGIRDVLLRGWGISHVWPHILILLGFAVVLTLFAILGLKRNR